MTEGGFIGLEVVAAARSIGKDVTVVEVAPIPLIHAVGTMHGEHLVQVYESHGVEIMCGVGVSRISGEPHPSPPAHRSVPALAWA